MGVPGGIPSSDRTSTRVAGGSVNRYPLTTRLRSVTSVPLPLTSERVCSTNQKASRAARGVVWRATSGDDCCPLRRWRSLIRQPFVRALPARPGPDSLPALRVGRFGNVPPRVPEEAHVVSSHALPRSVARLCGPFSWEAASVYRDGISGRGHRVKRGV